MTNNKPSHTVKIDTDLYEQIIKQGKYGEAFTDILRRILND
jgi:negative regulator of replication initiation